MKHAAQGLKAGSAFNQCMLLLVFLLDTFTVSIPLIVSYLSLEKEPSSLFQVCMLNARSKKISEIESLQSLART